MTIERPFVQMPILLEWCKENCEGAYSIELWVCHFELESDAVLFKLRFPE